LRSSPKSIVLLLAFLLLPAGLFAREVSLTLLFTSDHHGQLLPASNGKGGVARRLTLIQQVRNEVGANRVVLLDAGDVFTGTALSGLTRGEADAAAYQLMGYDAVLLGNHDFDHGKDGIRNTARKFRMPWLSTNAVDRSTSQNFVRAYVFRTAGLRVGIIGLSNPDTTELTAKGNTRGIAFNPPSATVKGMRTLLKKESSVFVVLSHLGLEEDKKLAKLDPFLHVIIGGHDHRALEKPVVEARKDGSPAGPIVAHAGGRGEFLGRLDLTLDGNRKDGYRVVRYEYRLLPVDGSVTPDPAMEELLAKYAGQVDLAKMEEVIGAASSDIPRVFDQEGVWGWLAAEAMRKAARADAAFLNSGTFRSDVAQGPLNRASLFELVPFDDEWVVRAMPGNVLERTLRRSLEKRGTGAFLQLAGLRVKASGTGRTAVFEVWVDGEPLDPKRVYRVAMNDYLADGGDGYSFLKTLRAPLPTATPGEKQGPVTGSLRDLLLEAVRDRGRVSAGDGEKPWDIAP
jgi:2',3'-cyclic-nucleotide 2'-phosphodiesterase (5'-nucleotidase family)